MKENKRNETVCMECGCIIAECEATLVNPGCRDEQIVCNDCLNEYFQCSHCGEFYSHNHEWESDSELTVCDKCQENYVVCPDCSEIIHIDHAFYLHNEYYCQNCYESRINDSLNEILEDYSYKPEPIFLGDCTDNLFLGIELEVDCGNSILAASSILEHFHDVYLKHDGSLETGFEIVSHPATLAYHKYELGWEDITNICSDHDMKSHDTRTCGLHCHVSRAFFGCDTDEQDLHIAKLILLINKFWESHIITFTRRNPIQLNRWAAKPSVTIEENDTEADIVDKVKNTRYAGRYQGINLQNVETVEFRMFRGTLKLNTLLATLQFVDCICRYAKAMKLSDFYTTDWSDLFVGKDEQYPELFVYLKEKELI